MLDSVPKLTVLTVTGHLSAITDILALVTILLAYSIHTTFVNVLATPLTRLSNTMAATFVLPVGVTLIAGPLPLAPVATVSIAYLLPTLSLKPLVVNSVTLLGSNQLMLTVPLRSLNITTHTHPSLVNGATSASVLASAQINSPATSISTRSLTI